jgi:hypothetical protein
MNRCVVIAGLCVICAVTSLLAAPDPREAKPRAGKNERVEKLFAGMNAGQYRDNEFPALTWADIPALLERVDSVAVLQTFPVNSESSQRETTCTEGMIALWLIEGVRQGSKFPSLNALCFKRGVEKGEKWSKASEANHKELARLYRAWWKKVKELDPKKAAAVNPLKGTDLAWY